MTEIQKQLSDIITIKIPIGPSLEYGPFKGGVNYNPGTGCFSLLGELRSFGLNLDFCYNDNEAKAAIGGNFGFVTAEGSIASGENPDGSIYSSYEGKAGFNFAGYGVVGGGKTANTNLDKGFSQSVSSSYVEGQTPYLFSIRML